MAQLRTLARKTKVLVVDDDPGMVDGLRHILNSSGYEVEEAGGGEDCLKKVKQTSPDLVLLDVQLPDIDGFEVCRRIKSDAHHSIPVMHISAHRRSSDDQAEGLEAGSDGYMTHPINPRELVARVHAIARIRQAENGLKESREWFSTTLNSIGDGVIATDRDGMIRFMNTVAEKLTGWSLSQAQGQPLENVFHIVVEGNNYSLENPVRSALREDCRKPLPCPVRLVARDGTERIIDDSASPIKNTSGETIGAVLVFHDITDRMEAGKGLRESHKRFRRLYESQLVGIAFWNAEGKIIEANGLYLEITGFSQQDITNRVIGLEHLLSSELSFGSYHFWNQLHRSQSCPRLFAHHIRKDGSRLPILLELALLEEDQKHGILLVVPIPDARLSTSAASSVCSQNASNSAFPAEMTTSTRFGAVGITDSHEVKWATDSAKRWLEQYFAYRVAPSQKLPMALVEWVQAQRQTEPDTSIKEAENAPLVVERDGKRLIIRLADESSQTNILLLTEENVTETPQELVELGLTERESQVLHWIAQGKTYPEIAIILGLSPRTVESHAARVLRKLGVENRVSAVRYLLELAQRR